MLEISDLPALNASLNAVAAVLLVGGYLSIRAGRVARHRAFMLAALGVSLAFLVSYTVYHAQVGSRPFEGDGLIRAAYFAVLIPHVILAAVMAPMAVITVTRALRGQIVRHRAIARWTLPIWLYVSVTGVVVYWMLYG